MGRIASILAVALLLSSCAIHQFAPPSRQGPLARIPWSGPLQQPPARASGWLALRQEILRNPQNRIVRVSEGSETFVLRF
jgi:hypothetical protein